MFGIFRKCAGLALLILCLVVATAATQAQATGGLRAGATTAKLTVSKATPKPVCKIGSITLRGNAFLMLKASCKVGTKNLRFSSSWSRSFADLSGARCRFGAATGTGAKTTLPANPNSQYRGSMLPGITKVTFTIKAVWQGKPVKAAKTWSKTNWDTHVLCGGPPKLTALPGAGPPVCTWGTDPTFDGRVAVAGAIRCIGVSVASGGCRWVKQGFVASGSFLRPYYYIACASDDGRQYNSTVVFKPMYGATTATDKCGRSFGYLGGSFNASPRWGPGYVKFGVAVDNLDTSDHLPAGSVWYSRSIATKGSVDPCTTDLK